MQKRLALVLLLLTPFCTNTQQQEPSPSLWQKIWNMSPLKINIRRILNGPPAREETVIGILSITGEITSCKEFIKALYAIKKNPNIKALFLHIDSGGGSLASAEIIAAELSAFKKDKPVIVFVENGCHSSAYLIASAATTICAVQLSNVGSIGIVSEFVFNKKWKTTYLTGGKYKTPTLDDNYNMVNNKFKKNRQENVNKDYKTMCTLVAQNRNVPVEFIKNLEAKSYTSKDALELGLIDSIGSFSDAFAKIAELIKSNGDEVHGPLVFVDDEGKEVFRV